MAHIDRVAGRPYLLSSFVSDASKLGLFEAVVVSLGGLGISVFLIALGIQLPPP